MTIVHMVMLAARTMNQNSLAKVPREDWNRLRLTKRINYFFGGEIVTSPEEYLNPLMEVVLLKAARSLLATVLALDQRVSQVNVSDFAMSL